MSSNALKIKHSGKDSWKEVRDQILGQVSGQELAVDLSLATLLAKGHLLLEGPPGVGKTTLAKAISDSVDGTFKRIQMTSDLLPGEIIGILRPKADGSDFEFRPGPIFTNFLLADELNRTSPKTQAALLEAMAEGHVSVDGISYSLPHPFFVVATQNPLESHGVYPLAESQLDRFMTHLVMTLPTEKKEEEIYRQFTKTASQEVSTQTSALKSFRHGLITIENVLETQKEINLVHMEESVLLYAHSIIKETRSHPEVTVGISVRGGIQFLALCKAYAYLQGRDYVIPQDAETLAIPALAHRLRLEDDTWSIEPKRRVIQNILRNIPKPR